MDVATDLVDDLLGGEGLAEGGDGELASARADDVALGAELLAEAGDGLAGVVAAGVDTGDVEAGRGHRRRWLQGRVEGA